MKAYYKRWGNDDDPAGTSYHELKTRPCTDEDLGLGGDPQKSRFFEGDKASKEYVREYKDKMQCIDEDFSIFGDYRSFAVQHLSIQFEACDYINNSTCKSYEEIRQFMRRKFIMTLENARVFKSHLYDEDKISEESRCSWHQMNTVLRQESVNQLQIHAVTLQD